jgi:integrase
MPRRKREVGTRAPNNTSTVYLGKDGYWHGRVIVGMKDDGSPDRRHVTRKTEAKAIEGVRELERARDDGAVRKAGRPWTVEQWLTHWLEDIARPSVKYKAYRAYHVAVYTHLIPGLGKHRMSKVEPEHFERLYAAIIRKGRRPATAHQVHRTARTAFGEAKKRRHITVNPVELAKPPRVDEDEVEPFEAEEIHRLIATALTRRNGVRFVLALAIGTRQGETIGLKWTRLNKTTKSLTIARQLQRRRWEHGCADSHKCGARYHTTVPCKPDCRRHSRRPCPPPCPPDCTSHARWCPQRHSGGLVDAEVKSRAGRRGIVLPDQLFVLVAAHELAQQREREHAGNEWHEGGWMFTQPNGRPVRPEKDRQEWLQLLADAGVRRARLHDARHTAATVLLLLGVPERATMEFMGWSSSSIAKRYQHVTAVLRRDIAQRLSGFLWDEKT